MDRRGVLTVVALAAALAGVCAWRVSVGGEGIGLPDSGVVWELRLGRAAAGMVVGACLGVGGVLLQSLLRNPLASPDLIGSSSGAGLAVTLAVYLHFARTGEALRVGELTDAGVTGGLGLAALGGAAAALGGVYLLSRRRGVIDPVTMVLVGVIISVLCASATLLVQRLMPMDQSQSVQRWFLGQLSDELGRGAIAVGGAVALALTGAGVWWGRAMDAAALGDDEARSVGVDLGRLRAGLFVASGVLTAAAVVLAGPVGFVGLVCPHVVRLGAGPGHRAVVLGSALAGAALVVGADAAVKSFTVQTGRLPLGVLTSLIGGPVFLWLLLRQTRGR